MNFFCDIQNNQCRDRLRADNPYHTCQPPEYKNLEMSRNLCIVRMSLKTMSRSNLQKSPKRHSERLGDLIGSFRLDYEYEIEYEYDFRISNQ